MMRPPGGRNAALGATLLLVVACGVENPGVAGPASCHAPEILGSAVASNPNNVLSAVVAARVRLADSVAVRFAPTTAALERDTLDSKTPAAAARNDSVLAPVLGLLPETEYLLQLVAYNGCQSAAGPLMAFATGALPDDLPGYAASGPDPSPGYVLFAAGAYGLVIDNAGRVVWYHRFPTGPGLNFQAQPTGRYVARPPPAHPGAIARWVELDPLGTVTRTFGCARGLQPRFHDLIARSDGSYWVMCDETRTMDLSGIGGVANAQVTGTVVQHLSGEGAVLFQWSPFDHFEITDLDPADRTGSSVNWTHGNALDLDSDGDLLVSFRSLSEITKIDTHTGAVLWRMGGRVNQFTFEGSPLPAFARQHGVRLTGPGELLLLDNLGALGETRAERYVYDAAAGTARLIASYGSHPAVIAQLGGTTQHLPGGRTLVAFGNGGRVEEYDAAGRVVWRIEGDPGYVFRAQRIRSLYHPGVGWPR